VPTRLAARLILPALVIGCALLTAGAASAEHPQNSEKPSITGPNPPAVGSVLTGHNGSWIYADGSSCGADCSYTFEFSHCTANTSSDCTVVRGDSGDQNYTVQPGDAGFSILLKVTARKYDCNAHGVDCRWVERSALSAPTAAVAGGAVPPPAAIVVAPTALPTGVAGTGYSQTLSASGGSGPYTFAIAAGALPAGLSLAPAGSISGTPTQAGAFEFTVRATAAGGAAGTRTYTLRVDLALAPGTLPNGVTGVAYNQQLSAAGGSQPLAFRLTAGTLPDGLSLGANGLLAGTPTKAGAFSFTIQATDARGASGSAGYSLTVGWPSLTFVTDFRAATSDRPFRQRLVVSGGTAPYTWLLADGAVLPPGLRLGRDGILRGTPSAPAGDFPFEVLVTDTYGAPGRATLVLELRAAMLLIRPTGLVPARIGRAYQAALRAAGGKAPYRFTMSRGRLASGLRLTVAGRLVGTPRRAGVFRFVVRVVDANGAAKTRAYVLRVLQ
jgi:hypothetical protein